MPSDQITRADASAAMMRLLAGGWVAHIVHTAAEIGLADQFDQDAKDVASLANATATHPPSLARLLRVLAAIGLVDETDAACRVEAGEDHRWRRYAPCKEDGEFYLVVDEVRIAKRGQPGTPQAGTWISLVPGWDVGGTIGRIIMTHDSTTIH